MHDYVMHYVALLDALGIDKVHLVGFSLGGFLAAHFATEQGHRVSKLVLVGPAGLRDKDHPTARRARSARRRNCPGLLVSNFDVLKPYLPAAPDLDFIAARYREVDDAGAAVMGKALGSEVARAISIV